MIRKQLCTWLVLGLILGVHRGYIALWKENEPEPYHIFPYHAALLPPQEVLRLEQGILVQDEHHLTELIKDYLS